VLPLTLVASIWGMNVHVPGESDVVAFWLVLGLMLIMLVGLVMYFRRRGWL
jgi:magnesium transporter